MIIFAPEVVSPDGRTVVDLPDSPSAELDLGQAVAVLRALGLATDPDPEAGCAGSLPAELFAERLERLVPLLDSDVLAAAIIALSPVVTAARDAQVHVGWL